MIHDFLTLSFDERNEIIKECGARLGVPAVIVEKDFWVCWTLDVLFQSSFADSLVFKGGTSLSKVFGAIHRFSEDIDLSVSTELLNLPEPGDSRNQANKWMMNAEVACTEAARDRFLPELTQLIAGPLEPLEDQPEYEWLEFVVDAASNSPVILFHYPTTLSSGFEYLQRSVKLELGSLTEQRPVGKHPVKPWLADEFPQLFPAWNCEVVALEIERTFWEKATILHAEHHRPEDKLTPDRYSRHYADTAALAKHADGQRAMALSDVRQKVVDWKARFFGSAWARYDLAVPGTFRWVPASARINALRRDYRAMREMYLSEPPPFDAILAELAELEKQVNR